MSTIPEVGGLRRQKSAPTSMSAEVRPAGRVVRPSLLAATVVVLALSSCSSGTDDEPTSTTSSELESDVPDSSASADFTEVDTTSPPDSTGPQPQLDRIAFDGVTFAYDASFVGGIIPARGPTEVGTEQIDVLDPGSDVTFTFEVDGDEPARLIVTPLRTRDGVLLSEIADDVLVVDERLGDIVVDANRSGLDPDLDLATLPSADETATRFDAELVSFVNGVGVRSLEGDPASDAVTYDFVGTTSDRRFIVRLRFPVPDRRDVGTLDGLVASVFVDGGSDALNLDDGCVDDALIVDDITIPPGTEIAAGAEFVKTWRVRNTGMCTWDESYSWAFAGGDALTVLSTGTVTVTAPGEELNFDVTLRAFDEPGTVAAQWQLFVPGGLAGVGPPAVLLIEIV